MTVCYGHQDVYHCVSKFTVVASSVVVLKHVTKVMGFRGFELYFKLKKLLINIYQSLLVKAILVMLSRSTHFPSNFV